MKKHVLLLVLMLLPLVASADQSGTCGKNLKWTFVESTFTLTISGSGAMTDYEEDEYVPWYSFRKLIKSIDIKTGITTIGDRAFCGLSKLLMATVPEGVTSLGESCFEDCGDLCSVSLPNTLVTVGYKAFTGCEELAAVTIPNSVTAIESSAFRECDALTIVTIGEQVKKIGSYAFGRCPKLKEIICYPTTPPTLGNSVFEYAPVSNITLRVPASALSTYQSTSPWNEFGTIKTIQGESAVKTLNKDNDIKHIYTLDGKRLETPQKGLNIIRTSDGSTRQVVIK